MTIEKKPNYSNQYGHSHCLLCGDLNPWSLQLAFHDGDGDGVQAQLQVGQKLQGYDGILHGGVLAALLDAAMTHCLFHRGVRAVTADLHVRYCQPVLVGSLMDIRSWILQERASLYRLKAEIAVDEQVMAWAEAKFMQRRTSAVF